MLSRLLKCWQQSCVNGNHDRQQFSELGMHRGTMLS